MVADMRYEIIEAIHGETCDCSSKHVPRPVVLARVDLADGPVLLCPTSLMNLRHLLWEYELTDGDPLGSITKHYGKFIRDLATQVYEGK